MKKIINKFLYPNKIIGFLIFNLSFLYLFIVFYKKLDNMILAIPSYILSAYSLTIFMIWFIKIIIKFKHKVNDNEYYNIYKDNKELKVKINLYWSLIFNMAHGAFNLFAGIFYKSYWFITFSVYYLLLFFMRLSLAKNIKNEDIKKEYKKLKMCGTILLCMNIIFCGMIVLIIRQDRVIEYPGYLIYVVALYNFYFIIKAFINVIKYKKNHRPILTTTKCINLTVAMISILSLEVAMLAQFGEPNSKTFNTIMIACTGFGIFLINSFMSIYMIVKANKKLKNIN